MYYDCQIGDKKKKMAKDKVFRQCILLTKKHKDLLTHDANLYYEGNLSLLVRKIIDAHYDVKEPAEEKK